MNKLILKLTATGLGAGFGIMLILATLRSFIGLTLGSGIVGAVPLAFVVGVVGVVGGILLAYNCIAIFIKSLPKD